MTERLYRLEEITGILGQALARVNRHDLLTFERPFNLFLDDVVRLLKEPPRPPEAPADFASPND